MRAPLQTALAVLVWFAVLVPVQAGGETAGARMPVVRIEAEHAGGHWVRVGPERRVGHLASEASGRRAARLDDEEHFLSFTLDRPANALTLRYALPDSEDGSGLNGELAVLVDGEPVARIAVTSRYAWFYGDYPFSNDPREGKGHHFYTHARILLPQIVHPGSDVVVRLTGAQRLPWAAIDLAEFELVSAPLPRPVDSVSITDFGADPAGTRDSRDAIQATIEHARARGTTVWIPPGTFLTNGHLAVDRVTIEGAGHWHSELRGAGVGLYGLGPPQMSRAVVLRNFAIIGEVAERVDHLQLSGIGGSIGGGSRIENLWLQHHKVGIWLDGPADDLHIRNLRIFDMAADGINFHRGVSHARVENTLVRGTGDDGLAAWSQELANHDIAFADNTVVAPSLANGIAVYGGRDFEISGNLVTDTVTQGGGLHLGNRFGAVPLAGRIMITNNTLVRSGSYDPNWKFGVGALWFYALDAPIDARIEISDTRILDSSEEAITLIGSSIAGIALERTTVRSPGLRILTLRSAGSMDMTNTQITDATRPHVLRCHDDFRLEHDLGAGITSGCAPYERN